MVNNLSFLSEVGMVKATSKQLLITPLELASKEDFRISCVKR